MSTVIKCECNFPKDKFGVKKDCVCTGDDHISSNRALFFAVLLFMWDQNCDLQEIAESRYSINKYTLKWKIVKNRYIAKADRLLNGYFDETITKEEEGLVERLRQT